MADKKAAAAVIVFHEDETGKGVISTDEGGRTRFGLAERWHPELSTSTFYTSMSRDDAKALALTYYEKMPYWQFDGMNSQVVATKCADLAVTSGMHEAILVLQESINAVGGSVAVDGSYGPHTEQAANAVPQSQLVEAYCANAAKFYQDLALRKHRSASELESWLRRAAWRGNV